MGSNLGFAREGEKRLFWERLFHLLKSQEGTVAVGCSSSYWAASVSPIHSSTVSAEM